MQKQDLESMLQINYHMRMIIFHYNRYKQLVDEGLEDDADLVEEVSNYLLHWNEY